MSYVDNTLTIPEILNKCSEMNDEEQVAFLSRYKDRKDFIWFVNIMYNTNLSYIKYDNTIKNYNESNNPVGYDFSKISNNIKTLDYILKLYKTGEIKNIEIANIKFRNILESVSSDEASFLYNLFLGRKTNINKKIYKRVFSFLV